MPNLYISDLDGTLLDNSAKLSDFSMAALKVIIESGVHFSIASARSIQSIQKVLSGIELQLPIIEFNGAFVSDLQSGRHLLINAIDDGVFQALGADFRAKGLNYFVSSFDGQRDNLYYQKMVNGGEQWYIEERINSHDPRLRKIEAIEAVRDQNIICLTLIDRYEKLVDEFEQLQHRDDIEVHLQENAYSPGWYWLSVHSAKATKDQAIEALIKMSQLESPRVVVFGDHTNDIKMMQAADEAVAVANGKDEVKAVADVIIPSNLDNGVVDYILEAEHLRDRVYQ